MFTVEDRSHFRDHPMLQKNMIKNTECFLKSHPQPIEFLSSNSIPAISGTKKEFIMNCSDSEVTVFPGIFYGQPNTNHNLLPVPPVPHLYHFNGLPVQTRICCLQPEAFSHGFPRPCQDFDYLVVIDFEATCDKDKNPHPQEIIEFPSVLVNCLTGQLEASFQTYVRPTCNHVLSDFCKDLTGIQQTQVDTGVTLSEALLRHDKWLEKKGVKNRSFAVVTWSDWDCRVMLESECRYKKIEKPPYFNRWINLKIPFREIFGAERCNLKQAVERSGLSWEGRPHCGLDDAKNTARLLSLILNKGIRLSITNSLMQQDSETLPPLEQSPGQSFLHNHQFGFHKHHAFLHYHPLCFCGLKSSKALMQKPGLNYATFFFRCGNWSNGASCHYFQWASA